MASRSSPDTNFNTFLKNLKDLTINSADRKKFEQCVTNLQEAWNNVNTILIKQRAKAVQTKLKGTSKTVPDIVKNDLQNLIDGKWVPSRKNERGVKHEQTVEAVQGNQADILSRDQASGALVEEIGKLKAQIQTLEEKASTAGIKAKENLHLKDKFSSIIEWYNSALIRLQEDVENGDYDSNFMINGDTNETAAAKAKFKKIRESLSKKVAESERLANMSEVKSVDVEASNFDLSDRNRPTYLAERYEELYEYEWCEAFTLIKHDFKSEEETIKALINILMKSYAFCDEVSQRQTRSLKSSLLFPAQRRHPSGLEESIQLSPLQTGIILDLKRQMADDCVTDVITHFMATNKSLPGGDKCKFYTTKCIELCWLMCVQTPQVIIDRRIHRRETFDTEAFKPYTQTGRKVAFVVWPPLYLGTDGPLLRKGVAQCQN